MKKTLIIVNSILGFFSLFCFIDFIISYIHGFDTNYYYKSDYIFHFSSSFSLLVSMLTLQVLTNIFIILLNLKKK